ncbi:MAG TPA: VOC family protein [Methylomirabilota bacterium]|nr:VOC family protein [Methylomirabilota bacterium]
MAIKVLELHHHGIRIGPSPDDVARARTFYGDVLGLDHDPGRPHIPSIDGWWMDVGGTAQIHLMSVNGQSRFAKGPGQDPSLPHVALAVADIQATRKELDRLHVDYWVAESVVGPQSLQIFLKDPFGNMIELHQIDTCRCVTSRRPAAPGRMA